MARKPTGPGDSLSGSGNMPDGDAPMPQADSYEAGSSNPPQDAAEPATTDRDIIVSAFMTLLAEKRFEEISLTQVAAAAGISLDTLRSEFSSTLGMLAAFTKMIDRKVLAAGNADMTEEPARERLFDALMRRLEAMAPYRLALRSLIKSVRMNPPLALALNPVAVRSQSWMLAAAGIDAAGPSGMVRAQGLALVFARVLETFVRDDDPGLARTMAALDRELARGQRALGMLDTLWRYSPLRILCRGMSRRRRGSRFDRDLADENVLPI